MKRNLLLLIFLIPLGVCAQSAGKIDSTALLILDHMSDVIGELNSCSYSVRASVDLIGDENDLEKQFTEHEVYMHGPDKMLVQSRGPKYHKGYWYDGKQVAYYSYTENNYAVIDAPATIMATIDTLNENFDIEFPAADFFYPAFTDDLLDQYSKIVFLGNEMINGKNCFHILATSAKMNVQIWISNDALMLPVKLVVINKNMEQSIQYEATFSDWQINPALPDSIFEFVPPPGATEVAILSKK